MRTLLKAVVPNDKGNQAVLDGTLAKVLQETFGRIKPEAAYFTTDNGNRTAYIIFDLADSSQIPAIAEPLFNGLNARIDFTPVMNQDDLMKGLVQAGLAS